MAYRLKAGESVPENIRRIVIEELDSAIAQLRTRSIKKRDEAIHEARKGVKKIRGVLKLMRSGLGGTYKIENEALRTIGAHLSELRDAGALLETVNAMSEKYAEPAQQSALRQLRKALERSKRETSLDAGKVMRAAAAGLLVIRGRVPGWPLKAGEFGGIARGLEDSYRAGRKAMAMAAESDKPELFHEWRKRAKDHWYHVRLLEGLWADATDGPEKGLHDLETWLGEEHNLFVLGERVKSDPDPFGGSEQIDLLLALASDMHLELRRKSFDSGKRLYAEKPKKLVRRFGKLWDEWQAESQHARTPTA
jgi:CHAD domain-containing protein